MLSKDISNFEVKIPGGTQMVQNRFLWHAEDSFAILRAVNDKQVPMFSDAYSMLANTFERMYKGFAIELAKLYPEITIPSDIDKNHTFQNYASLVNRYIPIATCREAYYVTLENLRRIQAGYTNAKFWDIYTLEDFQRDFKRYEIQRNRISAGMEQLLIQDRYRDVMHADEDSREDLDLE